MIDSISDQPGKVTTCNPPMQCFLFLHPLVSADHLRMNLQQRNDTNIHRCCAPISEPNNTLQAAVCILQKRHRRSVVDRADFTGTTPVAWQSRSSICSRASTCKPPSVSAKDLIADRRRWGHTPLKVTQETSAVSSGGDSRRL